LIQNSFDFVQLISSHLEYLGDLPSEWSSRTSGNGMAIGRLEVARIPSLMIEEYEAENDSALLIHHGIAAVSDQRHEM
jgi:hypothetical protein